ncbi:hypothetical protein GCM10022282_24620 [Agromyces indicus]
MKDGANRQQHGGRTAGTKALLLDQPSHDHRAEQIAEVRLSRSDLDMTPEKTAQTNRSWVPEKEFYAAVTLNHCEVLRTAIVIVATIARASLRT